MLQRSRALSLMAEVANDRGELRGSLATLSRSDGRNRGSDPPQSRRSAAPVRPCAERILFRRHRAAAGRDEARRGWRIREYKRLADEMVAHRAGQHEISNGGPERATQTSASCCSAQRRFDEAAAAVGAGAIADRGAIDRSIRPTGIISSRSPNPGLVCGCARGCREDLNVRSQLRERHVGFPERTLQSDGRCRLAATKLSLPSGRLATSTHRRDEWRSDRAVQSRPPPPGDSLIADRTHQQQMAGEISAKAQSSIWPMLLAVTGKASEASQQTASRLRHGREPDCRAIQQCRMARTLRAIAGSMRSSTRRTAGQRRCRERRARARLAASTSKSTDPDPDRYSRGARLPDARRRSARKRR